MYTMASDNPSQVPPQAQAQTVQISDVITAITAHCTTHRRPELKSLCFNLFEEPNDAKQAESVITDGLIGYIKNSYDIIKFILFEIKANKPTHLLAVFRNLVKHASACNDTTFITYLLNLQKDLNIEAITVLEAVCMTENLPFIRDIVTNLYQMGLRDLTSGLQSACISKLDNVVIFLFKVADDLKMTFNYENCLQIAIKNNSYGIINLFLDRLIDTSDKITPLLLEGPRREGKVMMVDFLLQKCKDKRITFRPEPTLPH